MPKQTIELTEAEWSIIKAVWENEPCAAPTIQEKLHKRTAWTYSTVRTLMDRMVAKGLLRAGKLRNLTLYRSAVTRQQAQRGEISAGELAELELLIKEKKKTAKK